MNLPNSTEHFTNKPPCHRLRNYNKPKSSANLPPNFSVDEDLYQNEELQKDHHNKEFILSLIKTGLTKEQESIPSSSWAGCRALISSTNVPIMHTGFLAHLPYPVTEYSTVFTALHNFFKILSQLNQTALPIFCDEGVFPIVFDIVLSNPKEFDKLIPMLGSFHAAKVVEHCIGKCLRGSRVEDALVETGVFGLKAVESLMNGSHYIRSLRGMIILADALNTLKWEAFWNTNDRTDFGDILSVADPLKIAFKEKDNSRDKEYYDQLLLYITDLKECFENFSSSCKNMSEMCQYWLGFLEIVSILKALIAADREGDWQAYLQAMQNLLLVFRECDSINYLRYASWYVEKMTKLP